MQVSRRRFLQGAALAPVVLPSRIWAAQTKPNSRLSMGFIGLGTQGRGLMRGFLGLGTEVLAVCDVDANRRNDARRIADKRYANEGRPAAKCDAYNDFRKIIDRKDIDAVCIATPDHWHAIRHSGRAAVRQGRLLREAADAHHPRSGSR